MYNAINKSSEIICRDQTVLASARTSFVNVSALHFTKEYTQQLKLDTSKYTHMTLNFHLFTIKGTVFFSPVTARDICGSIYTTRRKF